MNKELATSLGEHANRSIHLCEGLSAALSSIGRPDLVCMIDLIKEDAVITKEVLRGLQSNRKALRKRAILADLEVLASQGSKASIRPLTRIWKVVVDL